MLTIFGNLLSKLCFKLKQKLFSKKMVKAKVVGLNCLSVYLAFLLDSSINKSSAIHRDIINIITHPHEKL